MGGQRGPGGLGGQIRTRLGQDELLHSVAALSRMLLKGETLGSTLDRIARLAAELLPQADAATITLSEAGGPARTASSS